MTPKSPEEIAAKLYPITDINSLIPEIQRRAWLSRQAEVDELKRQVEECNNHFHALSKTAFDCAKHNEELQETIDEYERALDNNTLALNSVQEMFDKALAAKEKEIVELKWQLNDAPVICHTPQAGHDAEMCAFAEWIATTGYAYYENKTPWYHIDDSDEECATTELLKRFRDEKH
jgi:hypothetical protein